MIGSLIAGGLSLAGSIFGGISASNAMRKARESLKEEKRENQDWYDRRYNEDATQRADAQRMLTLMRDEINKRNRAAAGTQAVMGGTEESVAAAKAANNEAMADAVSQITAAGEARKDSIENKYLANKANLNSQLRGMKADQAAAITKTIGGVASAAGSLGSSIEYYLDARKSTTEQS